MDKTTLLIREARPTDTADMSAMAIRSKGYWGYSAEFMEACRDELTVRPEHLLADQFDYFVGEKDNQIIAYYAVSLIDESASEYELEALFVSPDAIGQGVGRAMMNHAKAHVSGKGGKTMIVHSDPHAQPFYEAAGGVKIGETPSGSIAGRMLPLMRIGLCE